MEYNQPSEIVKDINFGNDTKNKIITVRNIRRREGKTGDYKRRSNRGRKRSLI